MRPRWLGLLLVWLVAAPIASGPSASCAADPSAAQTIARYDELCHAMDRVELEIEIKLYFHGNMYARETLINTGTYRGRRDGHRWLFDLRDAGTSLFDGKPQRYSVRYELLVANKTHLQAQYNDADKDEFSVTASVDGESPRINSDDADPYARGPRAAMFGEGNMLFGYVPMDGVPLVQVFREGKCTLVPSAGGIGGEPALRLDCAGRYGAHRVWLAKERNYLPLRIEVAKGGPDLIEDDKSPTLTTVAQFGPHGNKNWRWPDKQLESASVVIDFRLGAGAGVEAISGFTCVQTRRYQGGETATETSICTVTRLDTSPDFSDPALFSLSTKISDGTTVWVNGAEQIPFEWRDGKVVKVVDAGIEEMLTLRPPTSPPRSAFIYIAVIVASALVLIVVQRRLRMRSPRE